MSVAEGHSRTYRILVSACEVSSDRHAALVLRALRERLASRGARLEAFGVGGPRLREGGLQAVVPAEDLLAMGGFDVLRRLGKIRRSLKLLLAEASSRRPDLALVVDYPDFHFRLAGALKSLGVPVVDYIPPKVWVWRSGRLTKMREIFAQVLCIFPFEPSIHQAAGLQSVYVGNPLVEELPLEITRAQAREKRYGLSDSPVEVLAVLPGSRPGELKRHWEPMLRAALRVRSKRGRNALVEFALPESEASSRDAWFSRIAAVQADEEPGRVEADSVRVSFGESEWVLRSSDGGLIKSGTSTLEAALLGCLQVVCYRPDKLTAFVFKYWIRRRYSGPVALVNLFTGWKRGDRLRAPELLMEEFSTANLERELLRVLEDSGVRSAMERDYADLSRSVRESSGRSPSAAAAEVLDSLLTKAVRV